MTNLAIWAGRKIESEADAFSAISNMLLLCGEPELEPMQRYLSLMNGILTAGEIAAVHVHMVRALIDGVIDLRTKACSEPLT